MDDAGIGFIIFFVLILLIISVVSVDTREPDEVLHSCLYGCRRNWEVEGKRTIEINGEIKDYLTECEKACLNPKN